MTVSLHHPIQKMKILKHLLLPSEKSKKIQLLTVAHLIWIIVVTVSVCLPPDVSFAQD